MPVKKGEFGDSIAYSLPGWKKIVDKQYDWLNSDRENPQAINFTLSGNSIVGHINSNDISNITLNIFRQIPGNNIVEGYYQSVDPTQVINRY